jgi:hypothetical protein
MTAASRAFLICRLVFRHWAATAGMRPVAFLVLLLSGAAGLCGAAQLLVHRLPIQQITQGQAADIALLALCQAVFFAAWGFGIFGAHHAAATYREFAFLRVRATGKTTLRTGTWTPVLVIGLLLTGALLPAAVIWANQAAGYGQLHAVAVLILLASTGTALGRLCHTVAGLLTQAARSNSLRLTVAYLIWLGWWAAGVALLEWSMRVGGPGYLPILRLGALVWPLFLWLFLAADPWAYLSCAAMTVAVALAAIRWWPSSGTNSNAGRAARQFRPANRSAHAGLLLARLLLVRLWRNPRTRESLFVCAFFGLLASVAAIYNRGRSITVDPKALQLLGIQIAVAFGVLARGLSSPKRPVEQRWLIGPATHVAATTAAVMSIGTLTTAPILLGVLLDGPGSARITHLTTLLMYAALGVALGFILTPALGSGGAELLAILAYFVTSAASAAALNQLPTGTPRTTISIVLTLAALGAAATTETIRRRTCHARLDPRGHHA